MPTWLRVPRQTALPANRACNDRPSRFTIHQGVLRTDMSSPEVKTTQSETDRKQKEFLFPAVATYYQEPLALVRGEGVHVWDDQGDKYLDCFGGVLTVSVGHANPRVNEAIINQVKSISD